MSSSRNWTLTYALGLVKLNQKHTWNGVRREKPGRFQRQSG
ncbi:hypothetical protein RSAG8_07699, partial [Rhizoctonia solani AG-8 WAC10335]